MRQREKQAVPGESMAQGRSRQVGMSGERRLVRLERTGGAARFNRLLQNMTTTTVWYYGKLQNASQGDFFFCAQTLGADVNGVHHGSIGAGNSGHGSGWRGAQRWHGSGSDAGGSGNGDDGNEDGFHVFSDVHFVLPGVVVVCCDD